MKRFYLFCLPFLLLLSLTATAQVGIGTTTPDASAQLEIKAANKGLLIPRVNSTSDVSSPANGLLVYQTGGTSGFYYNNGSAESPVWLLLSTNSSTTPTGSAGGDLTGSYPNPTLASGVVTAAKVADGAITLAKVNPSGALPGQALLYDGTNLVWSSPQATVADGSITNAKVASSAAISYSKLSLTNSIQNSDIVANAITTSKVANGTITTSKMADSCVSSLKLLTYAVTTRHIAKQAITTDRLNYSGATTGQVLTYNGTNVVWATPTGGTGTATYGYGTNSSGSIIAVVLGGTNIPLPNNQVLQNVTANGSNTAFTVSASGTYRIHYAINLTANLLASSRLLLNGTEVTASVLNSSQARNSYSAETILNLSAGDVLNVQLYGLLGAATLISGQGAALTIQQVR
ncbi:hypothetical protein GCM10027578_26880 [Spirosoma luteolum]